MRVVAVVVAVVQLTSWLVAIQPMTSHCQEVHSTVTMTDVHYSDVNADGVNSARCLARCLSLIKNSFAKTLSKCHRTSGCSSCALPCERQFSGIESCKSDCKNTEVLDDCTESCQFLGEAASSRPGLCPSVSPSGAEDPPPGYSPCVKTCDSDRDCPAGHPLKCCSNQCGRTCQRPLFDLKGLPAIPDQAHVRHRVKLRAVEVRWSASTSAFAAASSSPIVYVISSRAISDGGDGNELRVLPWRQIAQTTATSIVITDVTAMTSYQFTVSAVNVLGTRGPSRPSRPLLMPRAKKLFESPVNLTQSDVTYLEGGTASVLLQWTPPINHQVTKYKVTWREETEDGRFTFSARENLEESSAKEFKKTVPGNENSARIDSLKPETSYKVQVQAVWQEKEIRRRSAKASAFISTHRMPKPANQVMTMPQEPPVSDALQLLLIPPPISSLAVGEAYFQNGLLKTNVSWTSSDSGAGGGVEGGERATYHVKNATIDKMLVYWSPETCAFDGQLTNGMGPVMSAITQDRHFVIYDLRFDCQYLIRVQPVSSQGVTGTVAHVTMETPPCRQVAVVGDVRPDCPNSSLRVPEEPPDLDHSFIISGSYITARITWGLPQSDAPITGYQINWNQSLHPSAANQRQTPKNNVTSGGSLRILSKNNRTATIDSLVEAATYEVTVRATSKAGLGQRSTTFITTPRLQRPAVLSSSLDNFFPDRSVANQTKPLAEEISFDIWRPRPVPKTSIAATSRSLASVPETVLPWAVLAGTCLAIPSIVQQFL